MGKRTWRPERVVMVVEGGGWYLRRCGWSCCGRRLDGRASAGVLVEYVSRFDTVGRHGDGSTTQKEF
jgi:hypothetical protein